MHTDSDGQVFPVEKPFKQNTSARIPVCLPRNGNKDVKASGLRSEQGAFMEKMGCLARNEVCL